MKREPARRLAYRAWLPLGRGSGPDAREQRCHRVATPIESTRLRARSGDRATHSRPRQTGGCAYRGDFARMIAKHPGPSLLVRAPVQAFRPLAALELIALVLAEPLVHEPALVADFPSAMPNISWEVSLPWRSDPPRGNCLAEPLGKFGWIRQCRVALRGVRPALGRTSERRMRLVLATADVRRAPCDLCQVGARRRGHEGPPKISTTLGRTHAPSMTTWWGTRTVRRGLLGGLGSAVEVRRPIERAQELGGVVGQEGGRGGDRRHTGPEQEHVQAGAEVGGAGVQPLREGAVVPGAGPDPVEQRLQAGDALGGRERAVVGPVHERPPQQGPVARAGDGAGIGPLVLDHDQDVAG